MITIAKTFEWDMGHRVTNHDSLCRNPHGHRYKLIVSISGNVHTDSGSPDEGMVIDFGKFKRLVNENIIDKLDHSFMYWQDDPVMAPFAHSNTDLRMHAVPFIPTAECIATYIAEDLIHIFEKQLPGVQLASVTVFETPTSQAIWEPDHD